MQVQKECAKPKENVLFKECKHLRTIACGQAHRRGFAGFVFLWR